VKKEEVGEDKATTKVERKKTCVLAGESIYSRSVALATQTAPVDNHYISENLFQFFSVMTTRTDQLLMALHVILRALLIHARRPWLTHSDPDFDNIKVLSLMAPFLFIHSSWQELHLVSLSHCVVLL
jgi:hypothetical protein